MLSEEQRKVVSAIDRDFLVNFSMDLTNIHSPTGAERPASEFVYRKMLQLGMKARLQHITEKSCNALGELTGTGGGLSLMFNGHMDISYTEREIRVPGGDSSMFKESAGTTGFSLEPCKIIDNWIQGNGIRNMKSAMAAYLGAVDAIIRSGVKLKGDLIVAAVAGEIEKASVDDFRDPLYEGYGFGSRHLVMHGGIADMCIIGEPTSMRLVVGNMGPVWVKITIRGEMTHTAWCEEVINPIDRMMKVIEAIKKWIPDYKQRNAYMGVEPKVSMGAIQGGWPWRISRTPGYCSLYLDIRVPPGKLPIMVKEELNRILRKIREEDPEIEIDLELLITDPPAIVEKNEPVCDAIRKAHQFIFKTPVQEQLDVPTADAQHLIRYGIPSITYGPAGRNPEGMESFGYGWQNINDLVDCTKVYALAALDICNRPRE